MIQATGDVLDAKEQISLFAGDSELIKNEIRRSSGNIEGKFSIDFEHKNGKLYIGDSLEWLKSIESNSVDLIFADPPYNIKKADWDTFESQEQYINWSMKWISESARVLKDTGSLYVCGFSEILADLKHPGSKFFSGYRWLVWYYRNKANLGNDWGRSHESIIHFRKSKSAKLNVNDVRIPYGAHTLKYPSHPQAETSAFGKGKPKRDNWEPNPNGAKPKDVIEVPTTCNGMSEKTGHPTQKPEELVRKFILASSNEGDLVVDPFSGSGTTCVCSEQLNRKWLGCDLSSEYNGWAIDRINAIKHRDKQYWLNFDKKNNERRGSIR